MTQEDSLSSREIHDLVLRQLAGDKGTLDLYRYSDHLLFRIGLIQFQSFEADYESDLRLRPESDELWFLLEGECSFYLEDKRQDSPTLDAVVTFQASEPTSLLVPFGVAFGISTKDGCQLLRIATHDHNQDGGGEIITRPDR